MAAHMTVLSSKGQVVIPKDIRDELGLQEGDQLEVGIEGQRVVLRRASEHDRDWRSLRGAYGRSDQTTAEIMAEFRQEEEERERRKLEHFGG